MKFCPLGFDTLEDLFAGADRINELFLAKMKAYCDAFGGEFHGAPVKSEDRALQKVFRSYKEDFFKLCDLNRCVQKSTSCAQRTGAPALSAAHGSRHSSHPHRILADAPWSSRR